MTPIDTPDAERLIRAAGLVPLRIAVAGKKTRCEVAPYTVTPETVIKRLRAAGVTHIAIGKLRGVDYVALAKPSPPAARKLRFSDEQVADMRQKLYDGASLGEVADEYQTSREYMRLIKANELRKGIGVDASQSVARCHLTGERVRALVAEGRTRAEAAARLTGVSIHSAYDYTAGMNVPRSNRAMTPQQETQARQLYAEGMAQAEIGARLGVSQAGVSRCVRGVLKLTTRDRARALYAQGYKRHEIARQLHVCVQTAWRHTKDMGKHDDRT